MAKSFQEMTLAELEAFREKQQRIQEQAAAAFVGAGQEIERRRLLSEHDLETVERQIVELQTLGKRLKAAGAEVSNG